ncbi:unnamed protein product, partial [Mesorhabditis belari]|uniref:F-box domain-containing protein n=1 Tax=Mesorhabditis belari TaxID=2138241 RepID=A0AAF3F195_9BILA
MSDKPESSKTQLEEDIFEPLFQKDFLSQLPVEVAYRIITYLTPRDLMNCAGAHDGHANDCLQVHSGRIVTGSDDNTLRVFNVDDAQLAFTLTGHMGHIRTTLVSDDGKYIVSGAYDRTVRVWCGQTGAQRHVLQGHTSEVWCMGLHGTTLVSGSFLDQTLRVWDIIDGKCLQILTGDLGMVRCVQFDGIRVVSGALDGTVKVWNVQTGECLQTLTGHTRQVDSLLFEPERDLVVSRSLDKTIRVWDIRGGTCIAIPISGESVYRYRHYGMQLRGNSLVACYTGSDVGVWDIRDGGSCIHVHLQGVNGHALNITSLQLLDSGLLITSSEDGSVKLWDVDKGIFVRDLVRLQPGSRNPWRRRTLAIILLTYLMSNFLSVLITVWEMFDPASLWKPG